MTYTAQQQPELAPGALGSIERLIGIPADKSRDPEGWAAEDAAQKAKAARLAAEMAAYNAAHPLTEEDGRWLNAEP